MDALIDLAADNSNKKFLRIESLKPADVILSRSSGKESKWIAAGSYKLGSENLFSHAAIVVERGLIFESVDDGLLPTPLIVSHARNSHLYPFEVETLYDISNYDQFLVLRHPALENETSGSLGQRMWTIIQKFWGMEYPQRATLAAAAASSGIGRAVVRTALNVWDEVSILTGNDETPEVPGPFCSMLVAIVLGHLAPGDPLFSPPRAPVDVSPNALADDSCLKAVPSATITNLPSEFVNNTELATNLNRAVLLEFRGEVSLEDAFRMNRENRKRLVEANRLTQKFSREAQALVKSQDEWLQELITKTRKKI